MSDVLVALCVRAAAPPPERDAARDDGSAGAVRAAVGATRRLLARLADGAPAPVVLALTPSVAAGLADDDVRLLRDLEAHARVETCVTGATDAWLPALGEPGQRAQVAVAAAEHRRRCARQPLGLWPRDLALPHGLDAHLAAAGFRWALVPARALELGRPAAPPTTPVFFRSGLAAFGARPWNTPDAPPRGPVLDGRPPLAVVTADVADAAAALDRAQARGEATTPAGYLRRYPRNPLATPAPLAGDREEADGPYASPSATGMIRHLRHVEALVTRATARARAFARAPGLRRRALRQAAREALLAAAADWAEDAAGAARFRAHVSRCDALCAALTGSTLLDAAYLTAVEARAGTLFEEIDPDLFAPPR